MCRWEELNLRPALYEGAALTTELHRQMKQKLKTCFLFLLSAAEASFAYIGK